MNVKFIAFTNARGGAAKAAVRFKKLIDKLECHASFISIEDSENKIPIMYRALHYIVWVLSQLITKLQICEGNSKLSLNVFGSQYITREVQAAELLHIHWINNETLGIKDFIHLSNKSVITLHDEWFYCGAEHHALDVSSYKRVVDGYSSYNKNVRGIDLSKRIWLLKKKYYSFLSGVIFTVPSTWMRKRAQQSFLLKGRDIRVIANPIDTNVFMASKGNYRISGIEPDDFVITFGAIDGGASRIKGFDLLSDAIQIFSKSLDDKTNIKILIFGGKEQKVSDMFGIEAIEVGHISSEKELAHIYSLSSVVVVPSRAESFGQVAAESLSCQTPVVAFNYSGLTDIVLHKNNGYLAEPFKSQSLADGILWLHSLSDEERNNIGKEGRKHVLKLFSNDVIAAQLISLYKEFM